MRDLKYTGLREAVHLPTIGVWENLANPLPSDGRDCRFKSYYSDELRDREPRWLAPLPLGTRRVAYGKARGANPDRVCGVMATLSALTGNLGVRFPLDPRSSNGTIVQWNGRTVEARETSVRLRVVPRSSGLMVSHLPSK